jgi:hypothetical protein
MAALHPTTPQLTSHAHASLQVTAAHALSPRHPMTQRPLPLLPHTMLPHTLSPLQLTSHDAPLEQSITGHTWVFPTQSILQS